LNSSLPAYIQITPEIAARIREAVGGEAVIADPDKMEPFGKDATELYRVPELVVEVVSVEQIQSLMRLANAYRFPVTPRGLGTGLTGGAVPVSGGVLLSLAKMNQILSIDPENLIAVVEPGVVTGDLKKAARSKGLFYPPDPASVDTCSIGGNAATNAGGASCIKYGTTRNYVLSLEVVLPSGEKIQAGVQTRKGVVGYDLVQLLIGSEGTLGIITKLIVRLVPLPPAATTLVALFPDLPSAMRAVASLLVSGHLPSAVEFMDHQCLELVGDLLPFEGVQESGAFLLVETDGAPCVIEREIERMGEICLEHEAVNVFLAPDSNKRAQMWEVRRQISLRIKERFPVCIPEDVVVPIGRIAEFIAHLPELAESFGMKIYSFGHAGDGNIHLNITAESRDAAQRIEEGIEGVLKLVLSMGGTISGEHGIGFVKKHLLPLELSPESIRLQREIKRVFDPNLILNPGKVFL
jgi:D-lactate dehydrogenase (cytochrome)